MKKLSDDNSIKTNRYFLMEITSNIEKQTSEMKAKYQNKVAVFHNKHSLGLFEILLS